MSAKQEIYDHLIGRIEAGDIPVGQKMPTEKEVAELFGVSRSTVQAVMSRLVVEGVIERFAGRGSFVRQARDAERMRVNLDVHNIQSFEEELALSGERVTYQLVSFSKVPAPKNVARSLGVEAGVPLLSLYRVRNVGDRCIGSELRYFAPHIRLDVSACALETVGVHDFLDADLGIRIGRIDAMLRAVVATESDAGHLGVQVGAPLLMRAHTLFDVSGRVVLFGESRYVEPFAFRYSANVSV